MPAEEYTIEKTFYDITDTVGLTANQTKQYDAAGYAQGTAGLTNFMTAGTVTSSSTNGATVREITSIEIIPPQNSDGVYEDLRQVWLVLDNDSSQHYINLPGRGDLLMTPLRTQVYGSVTYKIPLGEPLWKVVADGKGNMPIRAIAPKFSRTVGLAVSSVYGATGTGSGGYRIRLKGYEYTPQQLAALASGWHNSVQVQTLRRQVEGKPALSFTYPMPAAGLSLATWNQFPGGLKQGTTKVMPYWHFAFNAAATDPNRPYVFTDLNALGGGTGHVEDQYQDLGLEFNLNRNAFLLRGFGVQPVPLPPGQTGSPGVPGQYLNRAGWNVNGSFIPQVEGNEGIFITPGVNDLAFGSLKPYVALDNVFRPVPKWPGELLIYGDNAVPFVGANGTAIAADTVAVGITGVIIEGVPA